MLKIITTKHYNELLKKIEQLSKSIPVRDKKSGKFVKK